MTNFEMHTNYLNELESESIFVLREVASEFENPVLLFSGGKDSILLIHLSKKAFFPSPIPFTILHVDTGHNFEETLQFRDRLIKDLNLKMVVASVEKAIKGELVKDKSGIGASRNFLQSAVLLQSLKEGNFDAAIGGGRRDEEKARAKERFFSHRDEFGQWDPKNQRPEIWNLFNAKMKKGEHFRVFPLSNWTELDVWNYIKREKIDIPDLYFSHERAVFNRNGTLLAASPFNLRNENESVFKEKVRCRTVGDVTCTGLLRSEAETVDDIIHEVSLSKITERGGRTDDMISETSMEDRKKEGYF